MFRATLLIVSTLAGALTATAFVTGVAAFRSGPVTTPLGTLDAGRDSHAVIIEVVGAGWDLGVPFPELWGQAWIGAGSQDQELFIGSSDLPAVRDYLGTSAYAFAGFESGTWQVRPVPGEGRPGDPGASTIWAQSSTGREVAVPAHDVIVVMRSDSTAPIRASMVAQFRPERAGVVLTIAAAATVLLLLVSIGLVRTLRPTSRRDGDADG